MTWPTPPPTSELTAEQYAGRACCWCGIPLWRGAVSAGTSQGRMGAHVLDVEVYACPGCANGPPPSQTPVRDQEERTGEPRLPPEATTHNRRIT
ncbi:hypothetical protein [Streptomyces sp. NPDC101149]|uniref:hypothetical protein n=1 Tax=Streptomyces sp. NPDC101149 TaxID=3366113 RepID=UPI0037F646F0